MKLQLNSFSFHRTVTAALVQHMKVLGHVPEEVPEVNRAYCTECKEAFFLDWAAVHGELQIRAYGFDGWRNPTCAEVQVRIVIE